MMEETNSKKRPAKRVIIAFLALVFISAATFIFIKWRGIVYPMYTLDFGNNQKVTLLMKRRGEKMTGVLNVAPLKVSEAPARLPGFQMVHHGIGRLKRFAQPVPAGEYAMEGLFMEPRSYRMVGRFPQPLSDFSIGGELPDAKKPGSYILVAAGAIANGALPAFDGTLPPKSASQPVEDTLSTPACPNCLLVGTLKKSSDSNAKHASFSIGLHYGHLPAKRSGLWVSSYVLSDGKNTQQIVFNIEPPSNEPLKSGQQFSLAKGSGNSVTYSEYGTEDKNWDSTAGTVKILSVNKGEITFGISGAQLKSRLGGNARGTLLLNGTGKMRGTALIRTGMI